MKQIFYILFSILCCGSIIADEILQETIQFTPPSGWHFAENPSNFKRVRTMVVGKGSHELRPSITLGTEPYSGDLKDYLKIIKKISEKSERDWRDLGKIRTEAGDAALLQEDSKTVWGDLRMLHVILLKNGTAYILTSAALKEEFPKFYPDFFRAMRSLRISSESAGKILQTEHS